MTTRIFHWSQVLGNPYRYKLHPDMLTNSGYKIETSVRTIGMSKNEEPIPCLLHFDRSYVINWLNNQLITNLKPDSYNQLQKVIGEAWRLTR